MRNGGSEISERFVPPSKIFPGGSVGKIFIGSFIKGPCLVVLPGRAGNER